ncbi:MAG: hypothetical protein EOP19_22750, partial [Hyphomicrobiales bacterium]
MTTSPKRVTTNAKPWSEVRQRRTKSLSARYLRSKGLTPVLQTSHHIVFNSSSGTAASASVRPEQLVERFSALGHSASLDADASRPFAERLQTARASAAPILVAAGGDGTVTALAEVAIQAGKT